MVTTRQPIVEDVVTRLTDTPTVGPGASAPLRAQLRRAAAEYDDRAAASVARALIESLSSTPDDARSLEALVILGLAHPVALESHRISLASEAHRLAALLERAGEAERGRAILELVLERAAPEEQMVDLGGPGATGTAHGPMDPASAASAGGGELVDHCLRSAEDAISHGRTTEAIAWLRQILRADPGRRDIARMIRDLGQREVEGRRSRSRAFRLAAGAFLISGLASTIAVRETRIARAWDALPEADPSDAVSLRARAGALEELFAREHVWLGMAPALSERERLRGDLAALATDWHPAVAPAEAPVEADPNIQAEEARQHALKLAEQGRYADAIADLRRSLSLATPAWEHRASVEADVAALEAWRSKHR